MHLIRRDARASYVQGLRTRFHRKRRLSKTGLKVETFENGDFRKRCVVVWTGENRDF